MILSLLLKFRKNSNSLVQEEFQYNYYKFLILRNVKSYEYLSDISRITISHWYPKRIRQAMTLKAFGIFYSSANFFILTASPEVYTRTKFGHFQCNRNF